MNETINRLAFAIQDEGMSRLQAQRVARTVLSALMPGDRIGRGLMVEVRTLAEGPPVGRRTVGAFISAIPTSSVKKANPGRKRKNEVSPV